MGVQGSDLQVKQVAGFGKAADGCLQRLDAYRSGDGGGGCGGSIFHLNRSSSIARSFSGGSKIQEAAGMPVANFSLFATFTGDLLPLTILDRYPNEICRSLAIFVIVPCFIASIYSDLDIFSRKKYPLLEIEMISNNGYNKHMKESELFRTFLLKFVNEGGRGTQRRLAEKAGIAYEYFNGILNGHKPGSEDVRGRIASAIGMTYEEMLAMGRKILSGEDGKPEERIKPLAVASEDPLIEKTRKILRSNKYGTALTHNIMAFSHAVDQEDEMEEMKRKLESIEALLHKIHAAQLHGGGELGGIDGHEKKSQVA